MAASTLVKVNGRPGVYWRPVKRLDGQGTERMYYLVYRRGGRGSKQIVEPIGRASEGMTEAKATLIRAARMTGKEKNNVEQRQEAENARKSPQNNVTLNHLWEVFKQDHAQNSCIRSDANRYEKHVQPVLGGKVAAQITSSDIFSLKSNIEKKGISNQTQAHILKLVKRIMNYTSKKGIWELTQNLVFDLPKVDNKVTENMTAEQLKAYFKAIDEEPDQDAAAFLRIALLTGMRKGAIIALRWDDIDFDKSLITLRGESAKNGKTVILPLSQETIKVLKSINKAPNSEFIFPGKDGKQRQDFRRIARRVKEKAGLPKDFRPCHGLRHCFASWLASSGKVDMYQLQRLLTHSSPEMTQRYAHLRDKALRNGVDVAGEIFGSSV